MNARYAFLLALVCTMGAFAEEETDERKIYEVEEITVTGSRIKSAETLAPAPIVVLSSEEIRAQGLASLGGRAANAHRAVQCDQHPSQQRRRRLYSRQPARPRFPSHPRVGQWPSLRAGGTGANSSVDLNAIPASVIERIEVLKDGASAVYGSDAIGGVVNIITKTAIEGIEIDYYAGTSGAGDGEVMDLSVTTGLQSEKGHIAFSAGYHNQRPVWTGDRSFSESDKAYDWELNDGSYNNNGSSATPEGHIIDRSGAEGNEAWQAVVEAAGDEAGDYHRDPDIGWRPFNWAGISSDGSGDTYNYQPENYLYTPQTRYSSFLSGSHTVAADAKAYFEVVYTNRQSDQKLAPTPLFTISDGIVVSATNRYKRIWPRFH